jgi:hypothetical protein
MVLALKPGTEWRTVYGRARSVAPEAFGDNGPLSYWGGRWRSEGLPEAATSPVDGSAVTGPPRLDTESAHRAVRDSFHEHRTWAVSSLAERKVRVSAVVEDLAAHSELLALLLVWETGKTWASASSEVDGCIGEVRWQVREADRLVAGRTPSRGPVGNVLCGDQPMGVLIHAMLVEALAGNAAIAAAEVGVNCLTLATALAGRHGLPFTLVSGAEPVAVLDNSQLISRRLVLRNRSDCWGIGEPGDLTRVAESFEDGLFRSRYVVCRSLLDEFLAGYLPVVGERTFGHPLAVESPEDPLPAHRFGALINDRRAKELLDAVAEAIGGGGVELYRGLMGDGKFIPGQDTSAYSVPVSILGPPIPLGGPVDTIVVVDTHEELLAETPILSVEALVYAVTD